MLDKLTTDQVKTLAKMAGYSSIAEIAAEIGATEAETEQAAIQLGINLDVRLVWCTRCATWRTDIDGDGRCKVCRLQERVARSYKRLTEVYAELPAELKEAEASNRNRGRFRKLIPIPTMPDTTGMSYQEKHEIRLEYVAKVQAWEERRLEMEDARVRQHIKNLKGATER